jgi:hypothetical protein
MSSNTQQTEDLSNNSDDKKTYMASVVQEYRIDPIHAASIFYQYQASMNMKRAQLKPIKDDTNK